MVNKETPANHYVDNKEFLKHLVLYKKKCKEYEAKGKERPRIPEYLGECILLIATKLNDSPNFFGYSWKSESIGDGIMDCIKYILNFDETRSNNPHAYFTTVCFRASLRRIDKEKTQQYVKSEIVKNSGILNNMGNSVQNGDDSLYDNTYLKFLLETGDINAGKNNNEANTEKKYVKRGRKKKVIGSPKKMVDKFVEKSDTDIVMEDIEPDVLYNYYNEISKENE